MLIIITLLFNYFCCCWALSSSSSSTTFTHTNQFSSSSSSSSSSSLSGLYAQARQRRIQQGPEAAFALYQKLVSINGKQDVTTATRLAASPRAQAQLERLFETNNNTIVCHQQQLIRLRETLVQNGYTTRSIAQRIIGHSSSSSSLIEHAQAPIYVTSAAAGTQSACFWPWEKQKKSSTTTSNTSSGHDAVDAIDVLIALFLVGLAVPRRLLSFFFSDGSDEEEVPLIDNNNNGVLVTCEMDDSLVYSLVQIMPVDLKTTNKHLLVMTDWHPRTLALTTIRRVHDEKRRSSVSEDAVMYIGPDSLALIQHWLDGGIPTTTDDDDDDRLQLPVPQQRSSSGSCTSTTTTTTILDVCAGSGVQALAALLLKRAERAVCVDVNPRALRFCAANAILNGVRPEQVHLVWGDLLTHQACHFDFIHRNVPTDTSNKIGSQTDNNIVQVLTEISPSFDLMTANPPFLPVPPVLVDRRHGLFSNGGSSGEAVLEAAIRLASKVLSVGGYLGVVSEFFFDKNKSVLNRIPAWWCNEEGEGSSASSSSTPSATALLLTNQFPVDVDTYATRRSDSEKEYQQWTYHLESTLGITTASPGLLYMRKNNNNNKADDGIVLQHRLVPKSRWGSIWTPSNPEAVEFTREASRVLFSTRE